jgi:hypothetical protein
VYPTTIANYLSSYKPKKGNLLNEWLDEEGEAYIITKIIKSKSFGVVAYDKSGYPMEIDIKGIQDLLGVSGKINLFQEGTHSMQYQGEKLLVFGFQAISFSIKGDNEDLKFKLAQSSGPTVMKGKPDCVPEQDTVLFARNELIDIGF